MGLNVKQKPTPSGKAFQAVSVKADTYRKLRVLAESEGGSIANTITALLEYYEANK